MRRRAARSSTVLLLTLLTVALSAGGQSASAQQQSASVEEVRRTIDSLLEAAAHISESAQGVLSNAERTRTTTDLMAGKFGELSKHTSRTALWIRTQPLLNTINDLVFQSV